MTANRPQPRPGVLDIAPYVPGKSSAPGVAKVFKLSSNETPLGPSESAIAAYRAVGEHLEDYPDGSATALREAIGGAFGLDPGAHRLRRRLRRSAQSARARLPQRRRRGDPHHARLPGLSDRHARHRRQAGGRAGKEFHRRRRRDSQARDAAHQGRVPGQSEQSDRDLHSVRRGQAAAHGLAADMCCWCSTRPMPNTCSATTTSPASSWWRHRKTS